MAAIITRIANRRLACAVKNFSNTLPPIRTISTSCQLQKVHKSTEKDKKKHKSQLVNHQAHAEDPIIQKYVKETERIEAVLNDELTKHFSLKLDLRQFEDLLVTQGTEKHKLSHLGRITMKNPQMIQISFAANPASVSAAMSAIQNSALGVNPQQDGIVIHIPVPRITRERREQVAHDAKRKLLNDYRAALNTLYSKYEKKNIAESKSPDVSKQRSDYMLQWKRQLDERATLQVEEKAKHLLTEVA